MTSALQLPAAVREVEASEIISATGSGSDPTADLLARLQTAETTTAEQAALRDLVRHTLTLDAIARGYLRESMIEILRERGRSRPAKLVDDALGEVTPAPGGKAKCGVEDVEPWPYPVDGAKLLDELAETLTRYLVLPEGGAQAIALWIAHTWVYERHMISPRLLIASPEKRCGKTVLLDLLATLCARPLMAASLTAAVMYRVIEGVRPTLLVDEADTFLPRAEELRGVINAGHRHGGTVLRCDGEDREPRAFACFGPVALAGIGRVADTITDRAIIISMRRAGRDERREGYSLDSAEPLRELARRCCRWAADNGPRLDLRPDVPVELHDRARDNWRVLFAIAEAAGRTWPAHARHAATVLTAREDDDSTRVQLLTDVREVFCSRGLSRIATTELLTDLHAMEDRPWGDWLHGRPMTPQALGRLLRPFGISAAKWRAGVVTIRGYDDADFADAWGRYL